MQTWLVTGGAGFIGGNFVLEAVERGIRVINLDALTYAGNRDTLAGLDGDARHVFVEGDIGDRALVAKLLAEHRPAAIVNFAAESHVDRSIDGPAAFIQTNVVGTLSLLEAARDYWKGLDAAMFIRLPPRPSLSSVTTADWASVDTTKLEPMKPAPPVTR